MNKNSNRGSVTFLQNLCKWAVHAYTFTWNLRSALHLCPSVLLLHHPPTPTTQTIPDKSLINGINDAWLPRGPPVAACSTTVNRQNVSWMPAHTHTCCLCPSPIHSHTNTGAGAHTHTQANTRKYLAWALKTHTQTKTNKHKHDIHTCTHRLWVSGHRLATSGDTGWLIALRTDGHTGERRKAVLSSLSVDIVLSYCLASPSLLTGLCWPSRLSLGRMLDLWAAFRDSPSWQGVNTTRINDSRSFHLF